MSALCSQAKKDLVEFEGWGECDKGTEAGVFGREGLSRALGVRHRRPQQGLQGGGREAANLRGSETIYLSINKRLGSRGHYSYLGIYTE